MFPILETFVAIFAAFAISRSWLRLKHSNESIGEFIFWTFLWLGVVAVVFFPQITVFPAKFLNIDRGIDVFVYFGLIALFYLVFRTYSKIEHLENDITKLSRKIALDDMNKIKKKKSKKSKK